MTSKTNKLQKLKFVHLTEKQIYSRAIIRLSTLLHNIQYVI